MSSITLLLFHVEKGERNIPLPQGFLAVTLRVEKLAIEDKRALSGYVLKVLQEHVDQAEKPKRK
jgi:hypothetical protein